MVANWGLGRVLEKSTHFQFESNGFLGVSEKSSANPRHLRASRHTWSSIHYLRWWDCVEGLNLDDGKWTKEKRNDEFIPLFFEMTGDC